VSKKQKILFLYHGGTIGMRIEQTGPQTFVNRVPQDAFEFEKTTERLLEGFTDRFEVSYQHVTNKDSSNMHPHDWSALAQLINAAQRDGYDAVAITHGTDSLQYTATALALALHGADPAAHALRIPVVLTGAQNSIYARGGDGEFNLVNLFRTIEAALQAGIADVLINFWDLVLLGCRAVKVNERKFRAFQSPAYPPVGIVNAFGVELAPSLLRRPSVRGGGVIAPLFADSGVISLDVEPGFDTEGFQAILDTGRFRAVILQSMGDGNIPTEGPCDLLPLIRYATHRLKIPIFLTVKTDGATASGQHYDAGLGALEAGAIPCFDHTSSAVAVKVRWLIANGICRDIPEFSAAMATNFAGEVTVPA
jgi:L-asparaginase/Glu-tRNA(Gln) amidotransferase subunit D